MIVSIEEIRQEGLVLDRELSESFLTSVLNEDGAETGFQPAGPAKLHAEFEKVSDKLVLTGKTRLKVTGACRRCLAETSSEVPVEFKLGLVRQPVGPADEDDEEGTREEQGRRDLEGAAASFDTTAVEEEVIEGREIDLGGIVREQILLALPMDLLCREDCKGLCTVCGKDLNQGDCGCERKVADPRWAALKNIKLN